MDISETSSPNLELLAMLSATMTEGAHFREKMYDSIFFFEAEVIGETFPCFIVLFADGPVLCQSPYHLSSFLASTIQAHNDIIRPGDSGKM